MDDIVVSAITRLERVYGAVACEPDIRPDFSGLTRERLPIVVLALMNRGLRTAREIGEHLMSHGAPLDWEELLDVLAEHHAERHRVNGFCRGLWRNDGQGVFTPHISVGH